MPVALLIILTMSFGTTFAAEAANPGDLLYPVKIHVNEEVRGFVTLGTEGKAAWDARRAERRLEEMEELSEEGKLTADVQAQVQQNFDAFVLRAQDRLVILRDEGEEQAAATVSAHFSSALRAHAAILDRLDEKDEKVTSVLNSLEVQLKALGEQKDVRSDAKEERKESSVKVESNSSLTVVGTSTLPILDDASGDESGEIEDIDREDEPGKSEDSERENRNEKDEDRDEIRVRGQVDLDL